MKKRTLLGAVTVVGIVACAATALAWRPAPVEPFEPTPEEAEQLALFQQPEEWFVRNLSQPPIVIDGQRLDPKLQYMSEQQGDSAQGLRVFRILFATPPGRRYVRHAIDRHWTLFTKVTAPMRKVEDRQVAGRGGPIPVRVYWPQVDANGPLPVLIYAHGGGYLFASVTALDRAVRFMANEAGVIVVSLDYRRAPEHPYPAAGDDGEDVFLWVRENAAALGGDPERIGFGGDSAGGHVAINVAQRQLMKGSEPPALLLLYYPAVGAPQSDRSYELFATGFGLDAGFFEYLVEKVFPGKRLGVDKLDDLIDPVHAESLAGMPPSIIATAGFDILRDSAHTFAGRLAEQGVPIAYRNYPSLTHSFLQFSSVIPEAERAAVETARLFGEGIRHGLRTEGPDVAADASKPEADQHGL